MDSYPKMYSNTFKLLLMRKNHLSQFHLFRNISFIIPKIITQLLSFTLVLSLYQPLISFQNNIVPTNPKKLTEWLIQDKSNKRIWHALKVFSQNKTNNDILMILTNYLMDRLSPNNFEKKISDEPDLGPSTLSILGEALTISDPIMNKRTRKYLMQSVRARISRLSHQGGPWNKKERDSIFTLLLVHPYRFENDKDFRNRVLEFLPFSFDPNAPKNFRDMLLHEFNSLGFIDFATSEIVEYNWGAIPRQSLSLEIPFKDIKGISLTGTKSSIQASIYSLSSKFFDHQTVKSFLESVQQISQRRTIIVLADPPIVNELVEFARFLDIYLVKTYGRFYSPWPRDPFMLCQDQEGRVIFLVRPQHRLQTTRKGDDFMGLELLQNLPESLYKVWGDPHWTRTSVSFHNGQVLLTENRAWISFHTIEPRILDILNVKKIPVKSLSTKEGMSNYLRAAKKAADELGNIYNRKIEFVHPMPDIEKEKELARLVWKIGGGAGYDLDSILTLIDMPNGRLYALVGDFNKGKKLLEVQTDEDLEQFKEGFNLWPATYNLKYRLIEAQLSERAQNLNNFLDLVSENLAKNGITVFRLPIFFVPVTLLRNSSEYSFEDFLISWNNIVLENTGKIIRAEGFSSLISRGDEIAHEIFGKAGCKLLLIPPLIQSVILGGGYRCASQHLRIPKRLISEQD